MKKTDEHIDTFTKKITQDAGLETPSIDFTAMVMAKVEESTISSKATTYEAPISRNMWLGIAASFALIIACVLLEASPKESGILSSINFTFDYRFSLPKISFSKILGYGLFFLVLTFMIEISLLKRYFERSIS